MAKCLNDFFHRHDNTYPCVNATQCGIGVCTTPRQLFFALLIAAALAIALIAQIMASVNQFKAHRVGHTPSTPLPMDGDRLENESEADLNAQYDTAKWSALIKYDPEIAAAVAALQPFGQKWVNELAVAYLSLNEKSYLPAILKKLYALIKEQESRPHESEHRRKVLHQTTLRIQLGLISKYSTL